MPPHAEFDGALRALHALGAFSRELPPPAVLRARPEVRGPAQPCASVTDILLPRSDGSDGALRVRAYRPPCAAEGDRPPLLCWAHGGGWVYLTVEGQSDRACRALCNAARCVVLSIDYRMAPEFPFPFPLDDVLAAVRWAASAAGADALRCDSSRIALAGACARELACCMLQD